MNYKDAILKYRSYTDMLNKELTFSEFKETVKITKVEMCEVHIISDLANGTMRKPLWGFDANIDQSAIYHNHNLDVVIHFTKCSKLSFQIEEFQKAYPQLIL